ncbi:hypothetical protein Cgig2_021598 [Carnegiea gigantea]|uniref:Uncharacterized protein n=1 Tax=Carnegiea gigantea TaxID=171969 RepID=A0A9Q1JJ07_9CARY|nr:hypothetical protein Cgig2_021598 [Carnegiea gigantea]
MGSRLGLVNQLEDDDVVNKCEKIMRVVSNFAFSLSIISVLTGVTTLYNNGLQDGGPAVMVYGWLIAGAFTMFVGLSMVKICSSYLTSVGLCCWSAMLAGPSWAPFASSCCSLNSSAITTSVDFSLAQLIQVINLLSKSGENGGVFMLMIDTLGSKGKGQCQVCFHPLNFENGDAINSRVYIFVPGLRTSRDTFTGYDASAHMTEETKGADKNGPKGIISAIGISIILFLSNENNGGDYAVAELIWERNWRNTCLGIVAVAIFFCRMSSVTSNSGYTFFLISPYQRYIFLTGWLMHSQEMKPCLFHHQHEVNKLAVPDNAEWMSAFISFCMALTA